QIDPDNTLFYWQVLAQILIGIMSPVLERRLGRRRCLFFYLSSNMIWAGLISTVTTRELTGFCMFALCLGDTFIVTSCVVSLIEMLPFHVRMLAVLSIPLANAIGAAVCMILFEGQDLSTICYGAIGLYFTGMIIAYFDTEESLCHLIIRNQIKEVQDIILKCEMELCEREGGDVKLHTRIAKKIYEDIVFL
ncbi:hypothetical protein PFISCL1PPCAC_4936, partial [Pristionchus fissidentatus]